MRKRMQRIAALLLLTTLLLSLGTGCSKRKSQDRVPLAVGLSQLSGLFNPFYSTGADAQVVSLTQQRLLTTDRTGLVVENAVEGETRSYQGSDYSYSGIADLSCRYDADENETTYTWTLRKNLKFSDGEPVTADDVIFSYYVLLDPAYDGPQELRYLSIPGLQNYLTQTSDAVYSKYSTLAGDIYAAGRDAAQDEKAAWFWDVAVKQAWMEHCRGLVDYCLENYSGRAESLLGCTQKELLADESLQVLFGMVLWGLAEVEGQVATGTVSSESWRIEDSNLERYYTETFLAYGGDPEAFFSVEATGAERVSVLSAAKRAFIAHFGPQDPEQQGQAVQRISGIEKLDKYTVSVTVRGQDSEAVYSLGISVAPLHYYGDKSAYNYETGNYGHPFGDLRVVREKDGSPLGAGPYCFVKYENNTVTMEGNGRYWRGTPLTARLELKDIPEDSLADGLCSGQIDIAAPAFSQETAAALTAANPEGTVSGSVICTQQVDLQAYAYAGLNAGTVNVGGNPSSEASRNLRKGLATALAACRTAALEESMGSRARLAEYPVSGSCWAAPYVGEAGYQSAYSRDVNGEPLYTDDMDSAARLTAAKEGVKGFLQAAGFAWDENRGKFVSAPKGAKLRYECLLPAGSGTGSAVWLLAARFQALLAELGLHIDLTEESGEEPMVQRLEAGSQEIWMAWRSTGIEPGLSALYYSANIPGRSGGASNVFRIETAELDGQLAAAESGGELAARRTASKAVMDIVLDWGVEVPFCQAQGCLLFSTQRLRMESLPGDMTAFWSWEDAVENLEINLE